MCTIGLPTATAQILHEQERTKTYEYVTCITAGVNNIFNGENIHPLKCISFHLEWSSGREISLKGVYF